MNTKKLAKYAEQKFWEIAKLQGFKARDLMFGLVDSNGETSGFVLPGDEGNYWVLVDLEGCGATKCNIVKTILHELTHVAQYIRGDLEAREGVFYWKNKKVDENLDRELDWSEMEADFSERFWESYI